MEDAFRLVVLSPFFALSLIFATIPVLIAVGAWRDASSRNRAYLSVGVVVLFYAAMVWLGLSSDGSSCAVDWCQ